MAKASSHTGDACWRCRKAPLLLFVGDRSLPKPEFIQATHTDLRLLDEQSPPIAEKSTHRIDI